MRERWSISGANGFIGSHIYEKAEKFGYTAIKMGREDYLSTASKVFIEAGAYGNMYDQKDTEEIYRANTTRVIKNILTHHNFDYKAYLIISTSSVELPHQTYYSASKRATEEFAQIYARETNKPVVIVRPYSITGVGEQREHLIPKLINSCITGEQMDFVPEPKHDFLDVSDFTDAVFTIIQNAKNYPGYVFPVGSGVEYSNEQVLQIVEKVTGKKANVNVVKSMREYDTKEWRADTTLMRSLDWRPTKTLEQSVKQMYEQQRTDIRNK